MAADESFYIKIACFRKKRAFQSFILIKRIKFERDTKRFSKDREESAE